MRSPNSTVKTLDVTVFPSTYPSISCVVTDYHLQGAHDYELRNMGCFADGKPQYLAGGHNTQEIQFVKRNLDGTWRPGVQTEQLLLMLKDRHQKLNDVFPSEDHVQFIAGIDMALEALERRVRERTERGVMGELKK